MPACESKLVSRSSRKTPVAKAALIGYRPKSCDRKPSLVGDRGPVLQVLGWDLTRMHWYYGAVEKEAEEWLCMEQNCLVT